MSCLAKTGCSSHMIAEGLLQGNNRLWGSEILARDPPGGARYLRGRTGRCLDLLSGLKITSMFKVCFMENTRGITLNQGLVDSQKAEIF